MMNNLRKRNGLTTAIGNWDWQPHLLKEKYGQLTLSDVKLEAGKEDDMLGRIGTRLNKSRYQVIRILKNLNPF